MPDLHSLPTGTRPNHAIRNNGLNELALERFKLRELAEGWPMYRDAREWKNFRSLFHPEAFVYTAWSGRIAIEDFIKDFQDGMDNGAQIMHRVHGSTVDLAGNRAVVKMKATISQRFALPPNQFCMFFEKDSKDKWGARYLAYCQEMTMGIKVKKDMPGARSMMTY